ncbi:MAG: class A beta-lactamase-related serine hydrolase [Elusimicrobia bacterium]|nr:class A beta-lactamase-related serine hydrolase [Elusimicrobiota bacterium]
MKARHQIAVLLLLSGCSGPWAGRCDRGAYVRDKGWSQGFINPLLDYDSDLEFRELKSFRRQLSAFARQRASAAGPVTSISVYFRDLNNGPWFGVDEKAEFAPASLLKVPIMMTILKQAEKTPDLLGLKLVAMDETPAQDGQTLAPDQRVQPGKPYTVDELLSLMIVYSDNRAHDLLLDLMDRRMFKHVFEDLSLVGPDLRAKEAHISVKGYATFFRILYNASYLDRAMSRKALELLSRSEFKDGLAAGLPPGTLAAHKFGERAYDGSPEKQVHDCGIIYHPREPYLACVMTRGTSFPEMRAAIRDASALVYRAVDEQVAGR